MATRVLARDIKPRMWHQLCLWSASASIALGSEEVVMQGVGQLEEQVATTMMRAFL